MACCQRRRGLSRLSHQNCENTKVIQQTHSAQNTQVVVIFVHEFVNTQAPGAEWLQKNPQLPSALHSAISNSVRRGASSLKMCSSVLLSNTEAKVQRK